MSHDYSILTPLFIRAPLKSYEQYDLTLLAKILKDDLFLQAISLASPVFFAELKKSRFDYDLMNERVRHTLRKYYNRMCHRATPFGIFASFSVGNFQDAAGIRLVSASDTVIHLLPDAEVTTGKVPGGADHLNERLTVNPTAFRMGNMYRFIQSVPGPDGRLRYLVTAIDAEPLTIRLLRLLASGSMSVREILERLTIWTSGDAGELKSFLQFLSDEQFLLNSSLHQGLLLPHGSKVPGAVKCPLDRVNLLQDIVPDSNVESKPGKSYFYAALERPVAEGGLPETDREALSRAVDALRRLCPPAWPEELMNFTHSFEGRFEQEAVPLLEALDPDTGISYGTVGTAGPGWLDGIPPLAQARTSTTSWTDVHQLFLNKGIGGLRQPADGPIRLTSVELGKLPLPAVPLPPTFPLMFTRSAGKISLFHAGGATASSLVGRFSVFGTDSKAEDLLRILAGEEERRNPDVIFADLDQRSEGHADNISRRYMGYKYTIPLNVFSQIPLKQQIRLADLVLMVRDGHLILFSPLLGKQVVPRLSTAYNFKRNELGIFRLLCDLQFQSAHCNLTLNLESLFPGLAYYPRIELEEGTVIAPARWYIQAAEVTALIKKPYSLGRLHHFLRQHGLPYRVLLGQGDQQLAFDLSDDNEANLFLAELKVGETCLLVEHPLPDKLVTTEGRSLAAQLIAFGTSEKTTFPKLNVSFPGKQAIRDFRPGSDYLYLKIYVTGRSADELLNRVVIPLLDKFSKRLRRWFFVRYADPKSHLRLRFLFTAKQTAGAFLTQFNKGLAQSGLDYAIQDLLIDTYRRELERYGAERMETVEAMFHAGSILVAQTIALRLSVTESVFDEAELAIWSAAQLCSLFYPQPESCTHFIAQRALAFLQEFGGSKELKVAMDISYRKSGRKLKDILRKNATGRQGELQAAFAETVTPLVGILRQQCREEQWAQLAADVIHMQINRSFSEDQRRQEMMVWHFLLKHSSFLKANTFETLIP